MKMKLMTLIIGGLLLAACNKKKIGDTIVEYSIDRSEISIDNFPHGRTGIEGFNTITYPDDFSFQKVDEAIYEFISSKNFDKSHVGIKLRYIGKDQYGKDTVGTWVYIGSIDVKESKKYADIHLWKRKFGIDEFFSKMRTKQEMTNVSSLPTDIKNDIMRQLSEPDPDEQNTSSIRSKKIDIDNGYGGFKFGLDIDEVSRMCSQSHPKEITGKPNVYYCNAMNPESFYISGRKVENVTFIYHGRVLFKIVLDLQGYDESVDSTDEFSKNRTGNEDVYMDLASKYGAWHVIEKGKEDEITEFKHYLIEGDFVRLERRCFTLIQNTLNASQGTLMCPGDKFIYTSKSLENQVN